MLRPIVQLYADPAVHDRVGTGLNEILQLAQALLDSFSTQSGVVFTISNPKRITNAPLQFARDIMESRNESDSDGREVGILVFPGLFKVRDTLRVCMFKAKVICRDEAGI